MVFRPGEESTSMWGSPNVGQGGRFVAKCHHGLLVGI